MAAATTTIVASGATIRVTTAYEAVRAFMADATTGDVAEFEMTDGGRAMIAAGAITGVYEVTERERNAIGFR